MVLHTNLGGNDRTFSIILPHDSKEVELFNLFHTQLVLEYDSFWFKTKKRRNRIRAKLLDYCIAHNMKMYDYKHEFDFR